MKRNSSHIDKAKLVELFNERSRGYYGLNAISAADKERILVNESYIAEQCKNINKAKEVIDTFVIQAFIESLALRYNP